MDAGHLHAAVRLGKLLHEEGDVAGATNAFRRALDAGQPKVRDAARAALERLTGLQAKGERT